MTTKKYLSPLIVGTAISLSLLSTACRSSPDANAAFPGLPTQVETLRSDTIEESSTFVGTLEAVQIVEIFPESQGRIDQILVEAGQEVKAGQVIMVLRPDQTGPQYEASLAGVDVARTNRDTAVKQLEIAKAQRDTARAEFELYKTYIPRLQRLFEEGAIEQLRLDEGLQQQEVSRTQLFAAEEQVATAELAVTQAEATIRQNQFQAQAALVDVQDKAVVAPIAGIVGNLPVKLGDYVNSGQTIVAKVSQTESLFLNLNVPANSSSDIRTGLAVELTDPTGETLLTTGSLTFVSPTVEAEGQTILAKARFRNVEGKLRDGQNVQARIIWETQPGVLIPTTAISRVGGKDFVFLVDETPNEAGQEVVRLSPVELGDIQGDSYQVLEGLEVGDRVAVTNIIKLQDGVPIIPESL